jgi:GTP-binding protein
MMLGGVKRIVALVGRPNVGKSRLFNRLLRRRLSIVHDQPGVTRDVVSARVDNDWVLMDTGGLGLTGTDTPAEIVAATERQVEFAIRRSGLVCFVVDAKQGCTPFDEEIANRLRAGKVPVLLVANKVDTGDEPLTVTEFYRLGLGEPILVSAEHGRGEDTLRAIILDRIGGPLPKDAKTRRKDAPPPIPGADKFLEAQHEADGRFEAGDGDVEPAPELKFAPPDRPLRLAIVGRPNVGKSSLGNRLLLQERLIVSDVPGTTRDSIELDCTYRFKRGGSWSFQLIDTAGIRHGQKISSSVEFFSKVRSLDAMEQADVVLMVIDAMDGITRQDKAIAGEALERRRPVIVVVNKWDLVMAQFRAGEVTGYDSENDYRKFYTQSVAQQLFFTPGSPVVFISAKSGYSVERMLNAARMLESRLDVTLQTARLNKTLIKLAEAKPPPAIYGRRFRIYYASQTGVRPYRIKLFCNQERKLPDTYRRYLEAGIVEEFGLGGCPVHFDLVSKSQD